MTIKLQKLPDDALTLRALAYAYMRSYNKLSKDYKSPQEMALYTYDYFYHKIKRFAKENQGDALSQTLMVSHDGNPVGFVRYSRIPDYYKENPGQETRELEKGTLDGYEYAWYRKVKFVKEVKLDDSTVILNQIYLDPEVQHRGLGTYILSQTLPKIKEAGVNNIILEYNAHNHVGAKFYQAFGFTPLAETQDLDHIIRENDQTKFCVSNVKMVFVPVDKALNLVNAKIAINKIRQQNTINAITQGLMSYARTKAQ